jgi:hypothetical protein
MSAGTVNTMVRTVRRSRAAYDLAEVGKRRRKLAERVPVLPLTSQQRIRNYSVDRGWTAALTPAQRRRLEKKDNRALGHHNPHVTKVDGAKAFEKVGAA